MDRLEQIIENLRMKGLRLTPQRLAVLKILVTNPNHPTIEEVYSAVKRDFSMTSLATIYKTIAVLKEMEEVTELHYDNQPNRYDGVTNNSHPHLICNQCGSIIDTKLETWNDILDTIQQSTGFQVKNYRMDIFGICPNCQAKLLTT